jgi:hypothetical protein
LSDGICRMRDEAVAALQRVVEPEKEYAAEA